MDEIDFLFLPLFQEVRINRQPKLKAGRKKKIIIHNINKIGCVSLVKNKKLLRIHCYWLF